MSNSQPVPKTINVPADCTTIQEAIDAAIDGDTVVVAQGTYKECIDFIGKAITVRSSVPHMPETVAGTVIDGGGSGSVVTFASRERDTSVLMGFTLTHGGGTQLPDGTRVGGGIYCEGTSPTISNNRITDNESDKGGGLYCYQSAAVIAGNTIADNSARWGGGGVYCESSSPVISTNIVRGNKAETGNGGGIYCEGGSPAVATNTICDNRCDNAGGGVCCVQCSPTIAGNTIDRNTVADSGNGGGIFYTDAAVLPGVHVVTVVCNLITGNRGGDYGGGMYYASQPQGNTMITVADNALSGNWARNGGGVLCIACSPVLVRNLISDNASDQGGGVMCWGASSPTIDTTVIAFNDSGGGLVVSDDPANPAEADVKHCNVYGNTGGNYLNWPDQTGTNGNVSENPLLAGWRPRAV